jgi:hypothetical protein
MQAIFMLGLCKMSSVARPLPDLAYCAGYPLRGRIRDAAQHDPLYRMGKIRENRVPHAQFGREPVATSHSPGGHCFCGNEV